MFFLHIKKTSETVFQPSDQGYCFRTRSPAAARLEKTGRITADIKQAASANTSFKESACVIFMLISALSLSRIDYSASTDCSFPSSFFLNSLNNMQQPKLITATTAAPKIPEKVVPSRESLPLNA